MDSYTDNYYTGLNQIVDYFRLAKFPFKIATSVGGHKSLRFSHKLIEYEISGIVGPKRAVLVRPPFEALRPDQALLPVKEVRHQIIYQDGPLLFGVWQVGGKELVTDKDPGAIIEYVLFELTNHNESQY